MTETTQSAGVDPIAILLDIEQRCRAHATALPRHEVQRKTWSGLGFRLGNARLVAPLGEVSEILTYPRLTRVPSTKNWVCGIANMRGTLLPVMDLREYLNHRPLPVKRENRVLVVHHKRGLVGVVVDEVLGLQHFFDEERLNEVPMIDPAVQPYITGAFSREGKVWGLFSMHALADNPEFFKVAV